MTAPKAAKAGRRPTAVEDEEAAAILAYADTYGVPKAAEKFGISERSLTRWRADLRGGKRPGLAKLVAALKAHAAERNRDLIVDTLDEFLLELQSRKQKLTNAELIEATEKVGNLRITRDALTGGGAGPTHGERPHADQPGSGPPAGECPPSERAGSAPSGSHDGNGAVRH